MAEKIKLLWHEADSPKRFGQMAQGFSLLAIGIEIFRVEPSGMGVANARPLFVGDRKPRRIAAAALDDQVIEKFTLIAKTEAQGRRSGRCVEGVAFPFQAAVFQRLHGVVHHQRERLCCPWVPLPGAAEPKIAELDNTGVWADRHEAPHAAKPARRLVSKPNENRVHRFHAPGEPDLHLGIVGERTETHVVPQALGRVSFGSGF